MEPTQAQRLILPRHRLATYPLVVFLFILLAGFAYYLGWRAAPTQPAVGSSISGTVAPQPVGKRTFTIGTFNIQSGKGEDQVYNLQRTADTLRDTDICGLQEVRGYFYGADEAHKLGDLTQRGWLFAPTERRFWHDDFGNGLLSRLPVTHWMRVPLPSDGTGGLRNLVVADVDVAGHLVHVLVTHIDRHSDQSAQLRFVSQMFESLSEPAVLVADLNQDASNKDVAGLLASPGVHDCLGETLGLKSPHIDWILARGLKPVGAGTKIDHASDHPMYSVDLEFPQ